jgi:hypothetical protein
VGVTAHEVLDETLDVVIAGADGFLRVDCQALGLEMLTECGRRGLIAGASVPCLPAAAVAPCAVP